MQNIRLALLLFVSSLLIVACGNLDAPSTELASPPISRIGESRPDPGQVSETNGLWPEGQSQEDTQGSVVVIVTAENLNTFSDSIDFVVALDTHSVDLSMDLATLATLATDSGLSVDAKLWDAPRGGHHIKGILSFPSSKGGLSLLANATNITLTIHNLDATARIFNWQR